MRPRLPTLLVIALVALAIAASGSTAEAMQSDGCLTAAQAEQLAQKTSGTTATYKLTGWTGPNGTKIVAYALRRIGCVIVDQERPYQYLLADGGGDPELVGRPVLFERNGKFVKVAEPFNWEPDVIVDVEFLTPKATVTWDDGRHLIVKVSNLDDRFAAHFTSEQTRPWGELKERSADFDIAINPVEAAVDCLGVYLPGTWELRLEGELVGQGNVPRHQCDNSTPIINATMPYVIVVGQEVKLFGAGFGTNIGRLEMRSGSFVSNPVVHSWTNWEIHAQIARNLQAGDWKLSVMRPVEEGYVESNVTSIQIQSLFHLYLPRIDRRQQSWR